MEIIHIVLGKANPARMNGVNKVVHELATQQALAGVQVSLWGITASNVHDYPGRPFATRLFATGITRFSVDKALVHAVNQLGPSVIVHLHGGFIPAFYRLALLLHRRNIPYVFTPHGSYNEIALQKNRWAKLLYFQLFERKLITYASIIHCLGKTEVTGLHRLVPSARTALLPYGFEYRGEGACPGKQGFIIGFCGRIDVHTKGLDLLISAFSLLVQEIPGVELWIIGDGPQRKDLEGWADALHLTGRITFCGSLYGEDKLQMLRRMHVFVHPSRNEGLPTAVLEAASLGIPCVVTEATNVGEVIRQYDCGAVIDRPDHLMLYRALKKMHKRIATGQGSLISANARRMVEESFNWRKIINDFNLLYHRA